MEKLFSTDSTLFLNAFWICYFLKENSSSERNVDTTITINMGEILLTQRTSLKYLIKGFAEKSFCLTTEKHYVVIWILVNMMKFSTDFLLLHGVAMKMKLCWDRLNLWWRLARNYWWDIKDDSLTVWRLKEPRLSRKFPVANDIIEHQVEHRWARNSSLASKEKKLIFGRAGM